MKCFAGIDVGSSTIKVAITDESGIRGYKVMPTSVHCNDSAFQLLDGLRQTVGLGEGDIKHVTSTGYGRRLVKFADSNISEITANVKGAVWYGEQAGLKVRTIINIGGQDTKVIGIDEEGVTKNFSMNDKCAAGTGRFLEALARILEVEVVDLGDMALQADVPLRINSTCTVFAETEIISLLAREKKPSEIIAGAHFAIAKRLSKMARRVKVTDQVFFDGGPALNKGLIKALEDELATDLFVPPDVPQVTTAIGAAMIAREEYRSGAPIVESPKTSAIQGTEETCQICPQ
ncbi:MAG: acyl-CoA dehydratase activase [Alphaproteobacteria bacterium]